MNASLVNCASCGAANVQSGTLCPICGKPTGGGEGAGFLPLIGWLFIPFAIFVYPILGGLSFAAMLAANRIGEMIGLSDGFRIIAIAITGYVSLFFTLPLERSVSRFGVYRLLRTAFRVFICVGAAIGAIQEADSDASGGMLFVVVLVILFVFLIARRLDRRLGVSGPPQIQS